MSEPRPFDDLTPPGIGARAGKWLVFAILSAWAAFSLFALLWVVLTSLRTDQSLFNNPWGLPLPPKSENYHIAWTLAHMGEYTANSVVVTLGSVFSMVLVSSMAAYAITKTEFLGSRSLFYYFLGGLAVPASLLLVPLFMTLKDFNIRNLELFSVGDYWLIQIRNFYLIDSRIGLILIYTTLGIPFSVFVLTAFFRTLPTALSEAAAIDGASEYQTFWRIFLPLAKPGLVTVAIFNFIYTWNKYQFALVFISDERLKTLPVGLYSLSLATQHSNNWTALFAGLVILMLPTVLIFLILEGPHHPRPHSGSDQGIARPRRASAPFSLEARARFRYNGAAMQGLPRLARNSAALEGGLSKPSFGMTRQLFHSRDTRTTAGFKHFHNAPPGNRARPARFAGAHGGTRPFRMLLPRPSARGGAYLTARNAWKKSFPELAEAVAAAGSPREARRRLFAFVHDEANALRRGDPESMPALEFYIAKDCARVLRNIFSRRSEKLADCSVAEGIWRSLTGRWDGRERTTEAFWQEIMHLFLGLTGEAGVYEGAEPPPFLEMEGRAAGRERSRELDRLARRVTRRMRRYATGLEAATVKRREGNRKRVLTALGGDEKDWSSYRWQLSHIIRDADALSSFVRLTRDERAAITIAREHRLPFGITPYYAALFDRESHRRRDHAVRAQVIPPMDYVEQVVEATKIGARSASTSWARPTPRRATSSRAGTPRSPS